MALCECSSDRDHPSGCHYKAEDGHGSCSWCLDEHGRIPRSYPRCGAGFSITHGPGDLVTITIGPMRPDAVRNFMKDYLSGVVS